MSEHLILITVYTHMALYTNYASYYVHTSTVPQQASNLPASLRNVMRINRLPPIHGQRALLTHPTILQPCPSIASNGLLPKLVNGTFILLLQFPVILPSHFSLSDRVKEGLQQCTCRFSSSFPSLRLASMLFFFSFCIQASRPSVPPYACHTHRSQGEIMPYTG